MNNNDLDLLNKILSEDYSFYNELSEDNHFSFFSCKQILKNYGLSHEELMDGFVKDNINTNINALYVFINSQIIRDDTDINTSKKTLNVELIVVSSYNSEIISDPNINLFANSIDNFLNLSAQEIEKNIPVDIVDKYLRFKKVISQVQTKPHEFKISIFFTSKCIENCITGEIIQSKIQPIIKKRFSNALASFHSVGARDLKDLYYKSPTEDRNLKYISGPITTNDGGYLVLVRLTDFYNFITDGNGNLVRSLFEANIRDYQQDVTVNKAIQKSLSEGGSIDFWWLNNGITITATKAPSESNVYKLVDPQVVNGLQTSFEIYRYFSNTKKFDDDRNILIRILTTDDELLRFKVIKATNSQTSIALASLWASDPIHRDIEKYFELNGWYYDRRKGYYRNQKVQSSRIIGISYLAQCIQALILKRPNDARARPTSLIKDIEDYNKVFSKDFPHEIFLFCVKLIKLIEFSLNKSPRYKKSLNDIKFYVGLFILCLKTDKINYKNDDILKINIDEIFDVEVLDAAEVVYDLYIEEGGNDTVAKGPIFIEKLIELIQGYVSETGGNFVERIIEKFQRVKDQNPLLRFPPEPNGYLHIGHAKSICLNFGLAQKYNGKCNLRYDDTNPTKEEQEYVDSIMADVRWLGFEPDQVLYASDYFEQLYEWAVQLIRDGKAYVDFSTPEEIAALKGSPTVPGTPGKYRDTSPEENLALFERMKNGEFPDGHCVLRAKIDLASPNMHLRDPYLYRIKHAHHHRTGDDWSIYPMYDWAHGQCDSIEQITHSVCTLEFIPHRALYDWFIEQLNIFPSKQYEFARLNLNYTVMSKRKLLQLVNENYVSGWDDPRMPTISGLRRRGYTPESIRDFARRVGVAKRENIIDVGVLEFCLREDLNKRALRRFAVLRPLKVLITNYPEGQTEWLETENNPEDPETGKRELAFSRELYIEQDDFMETPPPKYFRLKPGGMVRLKSAFIIQCNEVVKDAEGQLTELHCTYVPESRSGQDTSGLKVQGVIHWLSAPHAQPAEVRLYDRLFQVEEPAAEEDFKKSINPNSLETIGDAMVEPALSTVRAGELFQFTRLGYFCVDPDSKTGKPVFNRSVTLKDAWAKEVKKQG